MGFVVTVVSAAMPARRASRVAPIAALRDVARDRTAVSRRRVVIGSVSTAAAAATLLAGLDATNVELVGAGAVALFLAVSMLGPVLARPAAAVLGAPIAKLRGTAGVIARQNAMRNPTRTARTAASLMIGVALVSFLTMFAASVQANGAASLRTHYHGTAIVDSGAYDATSGLSPTLAAELETQPGVRTVSEQRTSAVEIDGSPDELVAFDTATIATLFDLGPVHGDLADLGADGIAVFTGTGTEPAAHLGDTRTVTFPGGPSTFTVRAIYDSLDGFEFSQFVDLAAFEAHLPAKLDSRIYLDADDLTVVERAASAFPTAKVLGVEGFIAQQSGRLDTILALVTVLLGMAVLIALLGVANTLALSIHERRRELGLLRAVGMSRAQVRASVRWESVIIALFGAGLGLGLGTFLTYAALHSLAGQGLHDLSIPLGSLLTVTVIAAGAGLAGVATAVLPARRAARLDVLNAIASG